MKLAERIREPGRGVAEAPSQTFQDVKVRLHQSLIDTLNFETLEKLSQDELRSELRKIVSDMIAAEDVALNRIERERVISEVIHEVTGFGPLEPLLADPTVSDILVNTHETVYVERFGRLEKAGVRFRDNAHLLHIINRIVSQVGRRIDEMCPMVDARLPDGSRVNAIIPPVSVDGPLLSIRRFGASPLRFSDLLANWTLTPEMYDFLTSCVRARLNVVISGGTGAGKTTLLNVLSSLIPPSERIITIEDAAELQLQQPHVCRLETRPPNIEGRGAILQRDLVRNSLRMRPDRIIVGEVRGAEVLDMLQAMNTGHEGSMTTIHANGPRDALNRLAQMIAMADVHFSDHVLAQVLSRAIHIIVQVQRFADGRRRVTHVSEITGAEGPMIALQDIFLFRTTGIGEAGAVRGVFQGASMPRCFERLETSGVPIDPSKFDVRREV